MLNLWVFFHFPGFSHGFLSPGGYKTHGFSINFDDSMVQNAPMVLGLARCGVAPRAGAPHWCRGDTKWRGTVWWPGDWLYDVVMEYSHYHGEWQ